MLKIIVIAVFMFILGCTTIQQPDIVEVTKMKLSSPVFENDQKIPAKYTCDGDNINPQLIIAGVPANSKSLALIMDDPDIPQEVKQSRGIQVFDHWVLFNISPDVTEIKEDSFSGMQGVNGGGQNKYTGPCPPPQYEPKEHRYFFKLYALDATLDLKEGASKDQVEQAMQGHILEKTELVGRYERK